MNVTEQEVFEYLDALRESGVTNMLEAPMYLRAEFDLDRGTARNLFMQWMSKKKED